MNANSALLTKEERDILILAALHCQNLSNNEIGQRLGLSTNRVKTLIHQACIKLKAHSRNEAIFLATRLGEITVNDCYSFDELVELGSSLSPDMLRRVAQLMERGYRSLPGKDRRIIPTDRRKDSKLTQRERDVLILAARGLTNKEIADRLYISIDGVRTFLKRACAKLGARKRADAVLFALKQREISVAEICSLEEVVEVLAPLGADGVEKMAQLLMNQKPAELFLPQYHSPAVCRWSTIWSAGDSSTNDLETTN